MCQAEVNQYPGGQDNQKRKSYKVLPNNRPKQESNLIHLLLLFLAKVYIFKGDYQEDLNRLSSNTNQKKLLKNGWLFFRTDISFFTLSEKI